MARFLWGSCNTSKKTHWINWQRVCLPTDEGGLGIRSLADSVEAFSLKMWWRFREQDSLWARYMMHKYCSVSIPLVTYRSNRFSPMWRRLFKVGDLCREQVRWVVGEGNISFWFDSWVTNYPLASISNARPVRTSLKVKDLWMGEQWNEVELWMMSEEEGLPEEVVERILQIPIDNGVRDRGRWKLSGNGEFSTASAWELVRNRAGKRMIFELIWGKCIGLSISFFLWRLLANRIPVDTKLQWRGISLASMCRCCKSPQEESRLHLFVNGEAARRIWQHFARWFPQVSEFGEIGENLELRFRWWQRQLGVRSGQHLCTILPCLIFWFIWTERNECVHREKIFEVETVVKRVNVQLRNLVLAKLMSPDQWRGCCPQLDVMCGVEKVTRRGKVGRVQWRPPDLGWVKLNVDGAFSLGTQRAGGGGVVRDHEGEILAAFSTGLKGGSSLEVEVGALWVGVTLAKQQGNKIWIESDADKVVQWLSTEQLGPAEVCTDLRRIRKELQGLEWKVSHIYREGNKAADFLAGIGALLEEKRIYTRSSVPPRVKALCRLDQLGLPNFRF